MRRFHELEVAAIGEETADSRRIALRVPAALADEFRFLPGQHLPVQLTLAGRPVRRTYSISSPPGREPLEIGVRIQPGGEFSTHVAENLALGDALEVMPPFGRFHREPDPAARHTTVAFAAGSGITPILSILRATLEQEPATRCLLFYGNRTQQTTMFIEDLYALKNRFPERLQLHFLFSREQQEFPIASGRLDAAKVRELMTAFAAGLQPDEAYVCGPDTMIDTVRDTLVELGMPRESVRVERYGAPRRRARAAAPAVEAAPGESRITVVMDGHRRHFTMPKGAASVVDGAAAAGVELPYSCKGGVCATCRTRLVSGDVRMDANYALEPWELERGFVLACQSYPITDAVTLDYDAT